MHRQINNFYKQIHTYVCVYVCVCCMYVLHMYVDCLINIFYDLCATPLKPTRCSVTYLISCTHITNSMFSMKINDEREKKIITHWPHLPVLYHSWFVRKDVVLHRHDNIVIQYIRVHSRLFYFFFFALYRTVNTWFHWCVHRCLS